MNPAWKTVRVFISSTFRDMQSERDHLVRFVFPRLREELLPHRIHLVDVDLRWGVTSNQDVLEVCREIMDECRPRFLCMLGGRYGWVPPGKNQSITAEEVHYGVLDRALKNRGFAYFYFRDEAATGLMREASPGEFREPKGSRNQIKLEELKQAIIAEGLNPTVYPAQWDEQSRRLTGLHHFGDRVYDDLLSSMREDPELRDRFETKTAGPPDEFEEENAVMEAFVEEHCERFVLGSREPVMNELLAHADTTGGNGYICLTGAPGSGKSALLAYLSTHMTPVAQPPTLLIRHFVGSSPGSTDIRRTLRRLCHELKKGCPAITGGIPDDFEKLRVVFPEWLKQAGAERHVVIILDAVNQFDFEQYAACFHWLPAELPSPVRIILSFLDGPVSEELLVRTRRPHTVELKPLTAADGEAIIGQFSARYHKKLEDLQKALLLKKRDAGAPLYLLAALEELRTLGTFEEISRRIEDLPQTTQGLFTWILERLGDDDGFRDVKGCHVGRQLVSRFSSLLSASRYGLSQSELNDLLEPGDPQGNIAALLHLLRPYLMRRDHLLDFYHGQFRAAASEAWLRTDEQRRTAHAQLSDYFRAQADPSGDSKWSGRSQRPFRELAHHLIRAADPVRIRSVAENRFFERTAEMLGDIEALAVIRQIAESLAEPGNGESSSGLIRCAEAYSQLLERIRRSPSAVIRMIQEKQIERAVSMIEGETNPLRRTLLEAAGSGLLCGIGEHARANSLRDHAKAAFPSHQDQYTFEQKNLLSSLIAGQSDKRDNGLKLSQAQPGLTADAENAKRRTGRFIPAAPVLAAYIANMGPIHRMVQAVFLLAGVGLLKGSPYDISHWFRLVHAGLTIPVPVPRWPFLGEFVALMLAGWLAARFCERWLRRNESGLAENFMSLLGQAQKAGARDRLNIAGRALAFHHLIQGEKLGLLKDDSETPPRWPDAPWFAALSSIISKAIAGSNNPKGVSRIMISAINGEARGNLDKAMSLGFQKTEKRIRESIVLQTTAGGAETIRDKWGTPFVSKLFSVFSTGMAGIGEEKALRAIIALAYWSSTAESVLVEKLRSVPGPVLSRTLLRTLERPARSAPVLFGFVKSFLPVFLPSIRPLRVPIFPGEPAVWMLLWLPGMILWMLFGMLLLFLGILILVFLRAFFTLCGTFYDPLDLNTKRDRDKDFVDQIHEIEKIANPLLWRSLGADEKKDQEYNKNFESLFLWSYIRPQRDRILTATAAYQVLEENLLLSGTATLYPQKILKRALRALEANGLLKWSDKTLLEWMGEKSIVGVLSRSKGRKRHTRRTATVARSTHESQFKRVMPLPKIQSMAVTAGISFLVTGCWLFFLDRLFQPGGMPPMGWALIVICLLLSLILAIFQHTWLRLVGSMAGFVLAVLLACIKPESVRLSLLAVFGTLLFTNVVVPWLITIGRCSNLIYPPVWRLWGQRFLLLGAVASACAAWVYF